MPARSKARLGTLAAALFLAIGAVAACAELPTASNSDFEECIWIDGTIHCRPT